MGRGEHQDRGVLRQQVRIIYGDLVVFHVHVDHRGAPHMHHFCDAGRTVAPLHAQHLFSLVLPFRFAIHGKLAARLDGGVGVLYAQRVEAGEHGHAQLVKVCGLVVQEARVVVVPHRGVVDRQSLEVARVVGQGHQGVKGALQAHVEGGKVVVLFDVLFPVIGEGVARLLGHQSREDQLGYHVDGVQGVL